MHEETAAPLSGVSTDLATRLAGEVSFDDRLTGWHMRQMSGNEPEFIYSLQEALDFMRAPAPEQLAATGAGGSIGYLDFPELVQWLGGVFGDNELAEAIRQVQATAPSYIEAMAQAGNLMRQRLEQCQEVLERTT